MRKSLVTDWTDETKVLIGRDEHAALCKKVTICQHKNTVLKVRYSGGSIQTWSCFSGSEPGQLASSREKVFPCFSMYLTG